jgi:hypothetical protein
VQQFTLYGFPYARSAWRKRHRSSILFTHGTIVMHHAAEGVTREECVRQVQQRIPSVSDVADYVPVAQARAKLWRWHDQGARITYWVRAASLKTWKCMSVCCATLTESGLKARRKPQSFAPWR